MLGFMKEQKKKKSKKKKGWREWEIKRLRRGWKNAKKMMLLRSFD